MQYEKTTYYTLKSYGQSKLAQILNSFELSKRLKDTGVTAVSLHPGFVATDIFRSRGQDATGITTAMNRIWGLLARIFALTVADGAKTTIYCATSEDVPKNNGKYFA